MTRRLGHDPSLAVAWRCWVFNPAYVRKTQPLRLAHSGPSIRQFVVIYECASSVARRQHNRIRGFHEKNSCGFGCYDGLERMRLGGTAFELHNDG